MRSRAPVIVSSTVLAVGFILTVVGAWLNAQETGVGGANIGAGVLFLFGVAVGAAGVVALVVALVREQRGGRSAIE
jgi:hypothetical protein